MRAWRDPSRVIALVLCVVFVAALLRLASAGSDPGRPNVIIICADALRADHLGLYGYPRPTSPRLDAFARRAVRFDRAYASSSWTAPTVAALFTAELPRTHGLQAIQGVLPEKAETLAEALSRRGYRTGAVSANFVHVTPLRGLAQGFDYFNVLVERTPAGHLLDADFPAYNSARADRVMKTGLAWIHRRDRRPFFLYLHTMDTHAGYRPAPSLVPAFDRGGPRRISGTAMEVNYIRRGKLRLQPGDLDHLVDLYDASIASWDRDVGQFLATLEREGLLRNTIVVVTADHGEEFMDHGNLGHALTLYEEMIHVPLVIAFPGGRGAVVPTRVRAIDVAPTILEAAGARKPRWHEGLSLPRAAGAHEPDREVEADLAPYPPGQTGFVAPHKHVVAILEGPWKVLAGPRDEIAVYRLDDDPRERRPMPSVAALDAIGLARRARALTIAGMTVPRLTRATAAQQERLRSLGYIE